MSDVTIRQPDPAGFGKDRQTPHVRDFHLQKICRSRRNIRKGAAVVEFAIVAPIFLLLVFGMIEYGRMLMIQQVITNASREGARVAVLEGSTTTDVEATINSYLDASSIDGATITVAPTILDSADAGDPVTVTVSINFNQVSWLPSPMYLGGTELSASTVMRREAAG